MGSRGAAGNTRKKDVLICELPLQRYRTNCHDREAGWDDRRLENWPKMSERI